MTQVKKRKNSKTAKHHNKNAPEETCAGNGFEVHLPSDLIIKQVLLLIVLSIFIFTAGTYHVQSIHENERSFSDLSDMEREITFRSEMGLYYYFFKTFLKANSYKDGLKKLRYENLTEYPDTINALERFNILPEISIGILYRILNYFDFLSRECFSYRRDDGFTYDTCVGMGESVFFYLQFAWYSAGCTALIIFYFGFFLSKSAFGGFLSVLSFYYNHAECSRVQWAPPLRETFAYPVLLAEMLLVTITLDKKCKWNMFKSFMTLENEKDTSREKFYGLLFQIFLLSVLTFLSLTLWQFSQFVLFTQFSIIFVLFVCGELTEEFMGLFSFSQLIGLLMAICFLQLNDMVVGSLFSCIVSVTFTTCITYKFMKGTTNILKKIFAILIVPYFTWRVRSTAFTDNETHIWNLLKSKFFDFQDFHTLIYTCSAEYSFLPLSVLLNLSYTGLLPLVAFVLFSLFYLWIKTVRFKRIFGGVEIHVVYNVAQCGIFCFMAFLFMRLKLFSNPHLCILASLFTSKYMPQRIRRMNFVLFLMTISSMSYQGVTNIITQHSNIGTFSYPPLEDLLNFINKEVPTNAIFAGPMTTTAAVLLSTNRPIVLHPHYEDVKIRNRTKDVYSIFSRKTESEIYDKMKTLHVNYLIIDYVWCFSKSKIGCLLTSTWDNEDKRNGDTESFCSRVFQNTTKLYKFEHIYKNDVFSLLKLK